jgi:hypothetical protein
MEARGLAARMVRCCGVRASEPTAQEECMSFPRPRIVLEYALASALVAGVLCAASLGLAVELARRGLRTIGGRA